MITKKQFFETSLGRTAYKKYDGNASPEIFYLPGHANTLQDHKGALIEEICRENSYPLLHWAYFGWDESTSAHVPTKGEGYTRAWLSQALEIFDALTEGPLILVGYSMGGYLALALAKARPERVAGIIGLAAGFGRPLCDQAQNHYGSFDLSDLDENILIGIGINDDDTLPIHTLLNIDCPIALNHALNDDLVSWKNTLEIAMAVTSTDVSLYLSKQGGHALDKPDNKEWLITTLSKWMGR